MTTIPALHILSKPYLWPHDSSFHPSTTALLIIDMQRDFCEEGGYLTHQGYSISPTRAIIPKISLLLSSFRTASASPFSFPIVHTREGHPPNLSTLSSRELFRSRNNPSGLGIGDPGPMGRLLVRGEAGHDIIPELYPLDSESVVDKPGKGAFTGTDLEEWLRGKGVRNLVVCGVTTDVCVQATVREGNDRGFDCVVVEDGCAATVEGLHEAALEMVRTEGGILGATAKVGDVLEGLRRFREGGYEGVDGIGGD